MQDPSGLGTCGGTIAPQGQSAAPSARLEAVGQDAEEVSPELAMYALLRVLITCPVIDMPCANIGNCERNICCVNCKENETCQRECIKSYGHREGTKLDKLSKKGFRRSGLG